MEPYDRKGIPITEYPRTYQNADLLGINGDGIAEYLRPNGYVFFVEFGPDRELRTPPEYGPSHEVSLERFGGSLSAYLAASIAERGEWHAVTADAAEAYPSG